MDSLSYADLENGQFHFRLTDKTSRTTYHHAHGIRAFNTDREVFPEEPMTRTSSPKDIPFRGVTANDITSHIRVWKLDEERNSKLISTTSNLMWVVWEAIRRLSKRTCSPVYVTIYAIRISEETASDIIREDACDLLRKISDPGCWEASNFSRSSSEQLYFMNIPAHYMGSREVFTLRELLNWLPREYFSTSASRLRSGRDLSQLIFDPKDSFYTAQSKILARKLALERQDKARAESDSPPSKPLTPSREAELAVVVHALASITISPKHSRTPSAVPKAALGIGNPIWRWSLEVVSS